MHELAAGHEPCLMPRFLHRATRGKQSLPGTRTAQRRRKRAGTTPSGGQTDIALIAFIALALSAPAPSAPSPQPSALSASASRLPQAVLEPAYSLCAGAWKENASLGPRPVHARERAELRP